MIDESALRDGAARLGVELSDVQAMRLVGYGELILKWNKVYNLTALRDPASVLTHHLLDSLSVLIPLRREAAGAKSVLDVGSGAGLPGVVIAVLADDLSVRCVDAVAKKAAFVRQVTVELGLRNLEGVHCRVERLGGSFDVVCSRAFASLSDFFSQTAHLMSPQSVWLAMKGRAPTDELSCLSPNVEVFHVEHLAVPGLDAERCIVWARKAGA